MKPVVALVGRPNVGKSTLFNRLTRSRDALVADMPGLTRDRNYGLCRQGERSFIVIDTGGLSSGKDEIERLIAPQVHHAVAEADAVLLLVDGRAGLTSEDEFIVEQLRPFGKPIVLLVNKSEGVEEALACSEFHPLGLASCYAISATHGHGVERVSVSVLAMLPTPTRQETDNEEEREGIRIAIVGRPNVGKSTLVNRLLGEPRMLASDRPGTTRDSISVPFQRGGRRYILVDTAGVRRRGRIVDRVEKFSVVKTLHAIDAASVVILVLDAKQEISEQDARLLGFVIESGKALTIAVNKWDGLAASERSRIKDSLTRKLSFIDYARLHFISALHGSGVGGLINTVDQAYRCATRKLSTPQLTRLLECAVRQHAPPFVRGRRIKMRYAHQGGHKPPLIVIHGNQTAFVPASYRRYLENYFRRALQLSGTPLQIEFRGGENPFQGRKNILTRRQVEKRKRLKRHVSRGR